MNGWKKSLPPILFAFASVAFLIAANVAGRVMEGEPLNYTFLTLAIVFFGLAVVFVVGRKSGGDSGPPKA